MSKRKTFPALAARLRGRLQGLIKRTLVVTVNAGRWERVSVFRELETIKVRVHRMFVKAPEEVIRQLALYIDTEDADASRALDQYIARIEDGDRHQPSQSIRTSGAVYDLQARFDALNLRFFQGRVQARITWRKPARSKTSMRLGLYVVEDRLIRISPALDRSFVPEWVVDWIIFHEMLHSVYPPIRKNGRWVFHHPEFLTEERKFPNVKLAQKWVQYNIDELFAP